jgi:hypothetical protein
MDRDHVADVSAAVRIILKYVCGLFNLTVLSISQTTQHQMTGLIHYELERMRKEPYFTTLMHFFIGSEEKYEKP